MQSIVTFLFLSASALMLASCGSKSIDKSGQSSSPQSSSSQSSSQSSSTGSTIIISEIVASSDDPSYLAGNDWIELFNRSSTTVDLSQYSLADSAGLPQALAEIQLNPGEYAVIAAVDAEDLMPPSPYVPFKLGATDIVELYLDNQVVDSLSWFEGDADEGESYGLIDGFAQTTKPTPAQANQPPDPIEQPTGNSDLKISEVVTDSADDNYLAGNDWIELYNSGDQTINLAQFTLADADNPAQALPDTNLAGGAYIVIAAVDVDDTAPPSPNVPFKLAGEDSVLLYLNGELVDRLDWFNDDIPENQSYGRIEGVAQATEPSPGAINVPYIPPNPTGSSPVVINEIVASSADETYLAGNDWIELYNAGDTSVDLNGYFIADSNSDLIALPNTVLAAGQFLVIAAADADDTNPPSPSVPFKLGGSDNLSLYNGSELVGYLSWNEGDAPEGYSFGLFNESYQTLSPTPEQTNQL